MALVNKLIAKVAIIFQSAMRNAKKKHQEVLFCFHLSGKRKREAPFFPMMLPALLLLWGRNYLITTFTAFSPILTTATELGLREVLMVVPPPMAMAEPSFLPSMLKMSI